MADTRRIGVVVIGVDNRLVTAVDVQKVLTDHGNIIIGRMGIPHRSEGLYIISVTVDGLQPDIDGLAQALSELDGVHVAKAVL